MLYYRARANTTAEYRPDYEVTRDSILLPHELIRNTSQTQISRSAFAHNLVCTSLVALKFCTEHGINMPYCLQNVKAIGWTKRMLWMNGISYDLNLRWVSDGNPMLYSPIAPTSGILFLSMIQAQFADVANTIRVPMGLTDLNGVYDLE